MTALGIHRPNPVAGRAASVRTCADRGISRTRALGLGAGRAGVAARAGLPAARFHALRHSCGALLVAQWVHLQVIPQILEHSNIRVTSAVYEHVGEQLQRDAAEPMASALE